MNKEIKEKLKAHKIEIHTREDLSFMKTMFDFADSLNLRITKSRKEQGMYLLTLNTGFLSIKRKFRKNQLDNVMATCLMQFILYLGISATVITKVKKYKI